MQQLKTVAQLREYVELGVVKSVRILRCPMKAGMWFVVVNDIWNLATSRRATREFASLDTAVSVIEDLGVRVADVDCGCENAGFGVMR